MTDSSSKTLRYTYVLPPLDGSVGAGQPRGGCPHRPVEDARTRDRSAPTTVTPPWFGSPSARGGVTVTRHTLARACVTTATANPALGGGAVLRSTGRWGGTESAPSAGHFLVQHGPDTHNTRRASVPVLTSAHGLAPTRAPVQRLRRNSPWRKPGGQTLPLNATEGGSVVPGPTQDPQSSSWYTQPTHALGCTCSFRVASPGCGRTVVWGGTTAPLPGERGASRVPDVANGRSRRGYGHHGWTRVACPLAHQRLWGFFFNGGLRTSCGSLGDPGDTSSRSRRWAIQLDVSVLWGVG